MKMRKTFLTLLLLTAVAMQAQNSNDVVDITSRFTYCWGGSESLTHNADGSITYHTSVWGGLVAWLGGEDWSDYSEIVFELSAPSTCAVQGLVMYPEGTGNDVHYMTAGTTVVNVELDAEKRKNVTQVALQTDKAVTLVVKRIYLKMERLPEYGEQKGQLKINELMQSNIDCLMDDLNKLGLEADAANAWQLPPMTIDPHGFAVVFADKVGKRLHTDFRLESGKGGSVYLFFNGEVDDKRENIEKQPAPNISLGVKTETDDSWGYQYEPTPGAANCGVLCTKKQFLDIPVFSESGRVLTSGTTLHLELSPADGSPEGTVVRYTRDGSEPTANSPQYTSPINIHRTTTVRAKASSATIHRRTATTGVALSTSNTSRRPIATASSTSWVRRAYRVVRRAVPN